MNTSTKYGVDFYIRAMCVIKSGLNCIMMRTILYSYASLLSGQSAAFETSILRVPKRRGGGAGNVRSGCIGIDSKIYAQKSVAIICFSGQLQRNNIPAFPAPTMPGRIPRMTLNSTHAHHTWAHDRIASYRIASLCTNTHRTPRTERWKDNKILRARDG